MKIFFFAAQLPLACHSVIGIMIAAIVGGILIRFKQKRDRKLTTAHGLLIAYSACAFGQGLASAGCLPVTLISPSGVMTFASLNIFPRKCSFALMGLKDIFRQCWKIFFTLSVVYRCIAASTKQKNIFNRVGYGGLFVLLTLITGTTFVLENHMVLNDANAIAFDGFISNFTGVGIVNTTVCAQESKDDGILMLVDVAFTEMMEAKFEENVSAMFDRSQNESKEEIVAYGGNIFKPFGAGFFHLLLDFSVTIACQTTQFVSYYTYSHNRISADINVLPTTMKLQERFDNFIKSEMLSYIVFVTIPNIFIFTRAIVVTLAQYGPSQIEQYAINVMLYWGPFQDFIVWVFFNWSYFTLREGDYISFSSIFGRHENSPRKI